MEEELMVKLGEFCKERTDLLLSIDGGNLAGPLAEKLLPCTDIWILDEGTVEKTLGMQPREACVRYWEMAGKEMCIRDRVCTVVFLHSLVGKYNPKQLSFAG